MESNGIRDKIQMSQATADSLTAAGKAHWIKPRENVIEAKGKGKMQTYWLSLGAKKALSASSGSDAVSDNQNMQLDGIDASSRTVKDPKSETNTTPLKDIPDDKQDRLVDWMVEILLERLKPMVST
jgi:Adenylate and Guanylate cyclase catalytic domain